MTGYTPAERALLAKALSRLLLDSRAAGPDDIAEGLEVDPDLVEALRDKVRADRSGPNTYVAVAGQFLAIGATAEGARDALCAALRRYADDTYLDPAVVSAVAVRVLCGPPGVFRDGEPYPPAAG